MRGYTPCTQRECYGTTGATLEHTSDEHKAGASIFNSLHYLFEMETMKRFQDPVLVAILQKLRQTNGSKLLDLEWQALLKTELDVSQLEPEAFLKDTAGWFESSYLWSFVSMACYSRARASARQNKKTSASIGCTTLAQDGQCSHWMYNACTGCTALAQDVQRLHRMYNTCTSCTMLA